MNWKTADGTEIPIKDLTDTHLNKIMSMYRQIAKRMKSDLPNLEALQKANPQQAPVLAALFAEHHKRTR